jgi:CubicO group peptidase (beta-lactamase class C family)
MAYQGLHMLGQKFVQLAATAAVGLSLAACNTIAVKTDSAPGTSVGICHTYAFANEHVANADQPAAYGNPLNAERLRVAVQNNLAAKGIQPAADHGSADCVVGYALGSRQVFDQYYAGWGGYWGGGWGWGGGFGRGRFGYGGGFYDGPWPENQTRIAVDLFDNRSHKPIWHASASQDTAELAGAAAEQHINAATAAIFSKLPVVGATTT